MRWNTLGVLVLFLGIVSCLETQDHAPASSDKTYHFPSASLTIAGDLKDVKLKGTIAQLVRALQQPTASAAKPKDTPEPKTSSGTKKIIHPSQLITKHNLNKNGKKLYYGDVPDTITVSSQSVKISQANTTGGKKSRHLQAFIGNSPSAVKTIEGVRVADEEADKYYTYRNARVIKNFLVENGRLANRHKKRQVIITDPQQYLAAAAAASAHGATTIIDTGLHGSNNNNVQPRTSLYYAQEPVNPGLSSGGSGKSNNNGASIYTNDPTQQRSHPHVAYPNQQQSSQTTNNGQTSAFSYNSPQQNAHMYVLQDGNTYNVQQYHGNQAASSSQAQMAQSQFFSRSGEATTAPVGSQSSQHGSSKQQPLSATIKQQYQPSLDTQAIQAAVQAVQQLEQQQQQQQQQQAVSAASVGASSQQQFSQQHQQHQIQTGQQVQISGLLQQAQQLAQASAPAQTVVLPQSLTGSGATPQEILAATAAATNGQVTAQYIQIQPSQEQSLLQLQQQGQQQYPAPNQFAERQTFSGSGGASSASTSAYAANPTQFVIQPQTYITGAGGQSFTVPVPVPVEQVSQQQQQYSHHNHLQQSQQQPQQHQQQQGRHNGQSHHHNNQYQQQHYQGGSNNNNNRQLQQNLNHQSTIADRMKHAFSQNFNRKSLERIEANTVIPALASTGIFLSLGALAAGWYLSKNNREVGIVRRAGKFSKKSGSVSLSSNGNAPLETKEKEGTANTRTRRDLASMVTPQAYNPGGAPEIDQATFFQSIIQQSLEKTQKDYDDQPAESSSYSHNQESYGDTHDSASANQRSETERYGHGPPALPPPLAPPRYRSKFNRLNRRPSKHFREDLYFEAPVVTHVHQGQGFSVHSAKNFARVAIPAVILTGAALGIIGVIFGWYISGDNREIAFLDSPTTNSIGGGAHGHTLGGHSAHGHYRGKRSLFSNSNSSAAWSDGWLIRTLKAIHGNPYENMPAPTAKSFVPYPYFLDKASSKTNSMEFKVSNNGLAGVLAGGAVLAVVALGLINSFTESTGRNLKTARYNHLLTNSARAGAAFTNSKSGTNPLTHLRSPRTMAAHFDNNVEFQQAVSSPSFFESILSSLEASGDTIMTKLNELGSANWQRSSCTKKVLCQIITSQGDDTIRLMEKKMASVMKMLPDSVSSSINNNYSDVLSSIYKRDCSAFSCSSHKQQSAPASSQPQSSIKIDQTVTSSSR